jgi:hypothetical protein
MPYYISHLSSFFANPPISFPAVPELPPDVDHTVEVRQFQSICQPDGTMQRMSLLCRHVSFKDLYRCSSLFAADGLALPYKDDRWIFEVPSTVASPLAIADVLDAVIHSTAFSPHFLGTEIITIGEGKDILRVAQIYRFTCWFGLRAPLSDEGIRGLIVRYFIESDEFDIQGATSVLACLNQETDEGLMKVALRQVMDYCRKVDSENGDREMEKCFKNTLRMQTPGKEVMCFEVHNTNCADRSPLEVPIPIRLHAFVMRVRLPTYARRSGVYKTGVITEYFPPSEAASMGQWRSGGLFTHRVIYEPYVAS